MKTSIALIGFMATGKTEVAKVLAQKSNKTLIDLDAIIIKHAGKPIMDIFRQDGEIRFRELEIEAVREVGDTKNAVIACGGGTVLNKINVDRLKKECVIICLMASPAVILKRVAGDQSNRPLLNTANQAKEIKALLKKRRPFYQQAADITIDTSRQNINAITNKILELVKNYESHD
jgi:shikimate kinase